MRMRFLLKATTLCLALGGAVGISGCDSITAGTLEDDPGNPKLVRVMFQDDVPLGGRGVATDLLEKTGQACKDTEPCPTPQVCGELLGKVFGDGKCHNPNSYDEVPPPIGYPTGLTGGAAGLQIRLVFNKIIDPTIETVITSVCAKAKTPCKANSDCTAMADDICSPLAAGAAQYTLPADIAVLKDSEDSPVPVRVRYDPTGSPLLTSDPVINPYGPALVIKPLIPLAPDATYKLVIKAAALKDRKGQTLADNKGTKLPDSHEITFKMEPLKVVQPWDCPSHNCIMNDAGTYSWPDTSTPDEAVSFAPNQYMQFFLNADADDTTADKITLKDSAGKSVKIVTFSELGGDPKKCAANQDPRLLNIVAVDDNGDRADLAEGDYELEITGLASLENPEATIQPLKMKIKVEGAKVTEKDCEGSTVDELVRCQYWNENVLLPSECAKPTPPDMTQKPADGGVG